MKDTEHVRNPSDGEAHESTAKKPFVEPELTPQELLPDVTTGFVGTFSPPSGG